jgi:hypothetical protein
MELTYSKLSTYCILLIIITFTVSCNKNNGIPAELPGTYTGKERVIVRYNNDGQFFFREDSVLVSLIIESDGQISGMVGEAAFEKCNVKTNRGWISRQLNIKTDFQISGMLEGYIFSKDTVTNKNVKIPFNLDDGVIKGSIFLMNKGQDFPIIPHLKLTKHND